ncbi:MAG TPA: potassium transporter TrkG [Symbiobacteriaceae bacterium]|nr:potassium transporter TrkG [Symbiobacteriaceae bacterium]
MKHVPARIVAAGYVILVLIGTLLLKLLAVHPISFFDAAFTATSALTVTGLTVVNTASHFSGAGQFVLLLLIQIGGLGWLTLALVAARGIGIELGVAEMYVASRENGGRLGSVFAVALGVLRTALVVQGIGACLLAAMLWMNGLRPATALWWGVFHSISAFNNAGFDVTGQGLVLFVGHWGVTLVVAALVFLGGLGFGVLSELRSGFRRRRLSIHTAVVLSVSAILLAVGTLLLYSLDRNGALAGLSEPNRWLAAFFHAVSARTAGFHTVDIAAFSNAGLFVIVLLMFIGASPVSTGGGIRTTTLAVAVSAVVSYGAGNRQVNLAKRQVPDDLIRRALVLIVGAGILLMACTLLLLALEPEITPMALLFEAVSAFATVGLSTGITAELSSAAQMILMLLMLVGKLGLLSVLSISFRRNDSKVQFPTADSMIVG